MAAASRTDPRHLDRFDPEILELRDVSGPEIERGRAVGVRPQERALAARTDEIGARFIDRVAARADRWADRRDDRRRAGSRPYQRAHEGLRHPEARALPTGMRRADAGRGWVDDEDRHAVGRADAEQHSSSVRPHRVAFRPRLDRAIEAHDSVPVDLSDPRDRIEPKPTRERQAIAILLVERKHRAGHAPLGASRETGEHVVALEERRSEEAIALDPRRGDHAHRVGVANARMAATTPASAPISQKRMVTFTSGHSNWLCSGAIRKIRLPRSLKLPTCRITESVSATKMTPATGRRRTNPVVRAQHASVAPMASAPVSPMMTSAGWTLNQRKARSAPTIAAQNTTSQS